MALSLFIIAAVSVLLVSGTPIATKPNIVFVLVDDWGYADVSFRNPAIYTPNFKELADTGVLLNRHYVHKVCSPSRAAFLTGRWPHHVHQFNLEYFHPLGTNINMTMLPAKLKTAGYKTHMVGKWHQGFHERKYLPINRGFDTSSGYLTGAETYKTQKVLCGIDYWKNDDVDTRNGIYDFYTYTDDLKELLNNHDDSQPLFLYLSLHHVHGPLEAPDEWLSIYPKNSTCKRRRIYQAMVSMADNITGTVVEIMKQKKMWENTIFVVSADNGGLAHIGSNYPLKGGKATFFEGGVRALAFASGGLIPERMRGKSTDGFIHIADWYTTFCKLAGVDPSDSGEGKFPVDGLDVWPIITGESSTTHHDVIVLGYDFNGKGAIISGNYKFIYGNWGFTKDGLIWSPLDPCKSSQKGDNCIPYCLYDIINDPEEKHDLSKENPDLLKTMLEKYNAYSKEPRDMQNQGYHYMKELPTVDYVCKHARQHGGYLHPYIDD